jgi:hypothetical protein
MSEDQHKRAVKKAARAFAAIERAIQLFDAKAPRFAGGAAVLDALLAARNCAHVVLWESWVDAVNAGVDISKPKELGL